MRLISMHDCSLVMPVPHHRCASWVSRKNIERHTAHTIVSWLNPKQWEIAHIRFPFMTSPQELLQALENVHQEHISYVNYTWISHEWYKLEQEQVAVETRQYQIISLHNCRKTSSISGTKSQNLNVSCILLQLISFNPLTPGVKLRMKM